MASAYETGDSLARGIVFSTHVASERFNLEVEAALRGEIGDELNLVLAKNLTSKEIESLGDAPTLKADILSKKSRYCNCYASWNTRMGTICTVHHIPCDYKRYPYTRLTFSHEFDGVTMSMGVTKDADSGVVTSSLYLHQNGLAISQEPLAIFELTNGKLSGVTLREDCQSAKFPLRKIFPTIDIEELARNKEYQKLQLEFFRHQLFVLD